PSGVNVIPVISPHPSKQQAFVRSPATLPSPTEYSLKPSGPSEANSVPLGEKASCVGMQSEQPRVRTKVPLAAFQIVVPDEDPPPSQQEATSVLSGEMATESAMPWGPLVCQMISGGRCAAARVVKMRPNETVMQASMVRLIRPFL